MMRRILLIVFCILVGCIVGVIIPLRPTALGAEVPLFSSWSSVADWTLRCLEVFGALAAVVIALFKEDILYLLKHPVLTTDENSNDFMSDEKRQGANIESSRYYKVVKITNDGSTIANDCQVIIDSISCKSKGKLQEKELVSSPQNLSWNNSGTNKEDIAVTCSRSFDLFQILPEVKEDKTKKTQSIPMSMMIGGVIISPEYLGGEYIVTLRIEAENVAPVVLKYRVEWTGEWHNQKSEMERLLVVEKLQ